MNEPKKPLTIERMMSDMREMGVFERAERRLAETEERARRIFNPQPMNREEEVSEMITRCVEAIREDRITWNDGHGNTLIDLPGIVRDVIEAMREPTEAMLRASPIVGTGPNERGDWAVNTKPAQDVWGAMIDAALAEGAK